MWRRCWILLPALASLATDCEDASRGIAPSALTTVEIVLESRPATGGGDVVGLCLARLGAAGNHVRPSWRDNHATSVFDPAHVPLARVAPNRFAAVFSDVPSNTQLTLTVHDENECMRRPVVPVTPDAPGRLADGRVTTGVSANGTPLTRVVGNDTLLLLVGPDGMVLP